MIGIALATIAGGIIALAFHFLFGWWRASNAQLGQPTPTSARVVSDKLEKAQKEAEAKADADVEAVRRKTAGELVDAANALLAKGRK